MPANLQNREVSMATGITSSVGHGGSNRDPDVRKVQTLLNRVPPYRGGPTVPLKVDGLCYAKTLAAIEKFQHAGCGFKWPDKRIDPGGRTWIELQKYDHAEPQPGQENLIICFPSSGEESASFVPTGSFASVAPAPPVTGDTLVALARQQIGMASSWVATTVVRLTKVRSEIQRYKVYTKEEIQSFASIETHFKVRIAYTPDVEAKARIDKINGTFKLILQALGVIAKDRLVGDPSKTYKAAAVPGGFFYPKDSVIVGRDFANCNPNLKAAVLIHECAHWVDGSCSHVATELPDPVGKPLHDKWAAIANPGKKNYLQMDYNLAIQNAYSYAQCALHNGLGIDKRPP
ncbi:MAG: hypothetical protein EHM18_08610 [Acidobacteria bacterium]|nr:MAG: hypothetical protein EHM18_08610 [Acidobacteriota bacterium]